MWLCTFVKYLTQEAVSWYQYVSCFRLSCNVLHSPLTVLYFTPYNILWFDLWYHTGLTISIILSQLNLASYYRELQKCGALKMLQLSGNTELSCVSLRRLLQHQPALHTIDLSGCCGIANYIRDSSPELWMALKGHNKLKSLMLNSQDSGKEGMEALWWEAWGARANVHRAPGGLLCLSLKE